MTRFLPALLLALVATGCSTTAVHYPATTRDAQPAGPAPSYTPPGAALPGTSAASAPVPSAPAQPAVAAPVLNAAVTSLLGQARSQYQQGNYLEAIATAERGLRIDRRAADLYLVVAQSYVQLDQPHKAKMFVQQGLRYAPQGGDTAAGLQRVQQVVGN